MFSLLPKVKMFAVQCMRNEEVDLFSSKSNPLIQSKKKGKNIYKIPIFFQNPNTLQGHCPYKL